MDATLATALLPMVKSHLAITWDDEDTDARVLGMIRSCAAYLDLKLGGPGDYITPGLAQDLLLERVRYMRDGALDVFESNYLSLLLAAQHERMVEQYAQHTVSSDT